MSSGGMTLSTLDFVRLLPRFMHGDLAVLAMADGMNEIVPPLTDSIQILTTWDKINELSEAELDDLAWELNIFWYDKAANIDIKREIILNSDRVYRKLGTKWAVENVITTYFGEGYITEWFQYGGEPGHFRVYSTNPAISEEKLTQFIYILSKVKRHSSHLDGIFITLTGRMPLSAGAAYIESGRDTYRIGASL